MRSYANLVSSTESAGSDLTGIGIGHHSVLPDVFGLIHHLVGLDHQLFRRHTWLPLGYADAEGEFWNPGVGKMHLGHTLQNAEGDHLRIDPALARQQHHIFVTAIARGYIDLPEILLDCSGDRLKREVSDRKSVV